MTSWCNVKKFAKRLEYQGCWESRPQRDRELQFESQSHRVTLRKRQHHPFASSILNLLLYPYTTSTESNVQSTAVVLLWISSDKLLRKTSLCIHFLVTNPWIWVTWSNWFTLKIARKQKTKKNLICLRQAFCKDFLLRRRIEQSATRSTTKKLLQHIVAHVAIQQLRQIKRPRCFYFGNVSMLLYKIFLKGLIELELSVCVRIENIRTYIHFCWGESI